MLYLIDCFGAEFLNGHLKLLFLGVSNSHWKIPRSSVCLLVATTRGVNGGGLNIWEINIEMFVWAYFAKHFLNIHCVVNIIRTFKRSKMHHINISSYISEHLLKTSFLPELGSVFEISGPESRETSFRPFFKTYTYALSSLPPLT